MQATAIFDDRGAQLAQRLKNNRVHMQDSLIRLSTVRQEAWDARVQARHLRQEVRSQLDRLAVGVRVAKEYRPVIMLVAAPIARRFGIPPADPVDSARKELHEAYAADGDPATRAELLASYDGFARSLALKFRHRESVDDLVQVARIGLLHAIDRFDPDLGRPFPLFARITITGELKRHIRDKTWTMRVPRSLQEDYLAVMRAVDELTGEESDSPTVEALAERCGMSVERVLEAMELRVSQRTLSIDAPPAGGPDEAIIEIGVADAGFGQLENRELLAHLLSRLPDRDRRIVELRYIDELTQSEIASRVGVSQMCVSRVLARTIGRLRLWARTAVAG